MPQTTDEVEEDGSKNMVSNLPLLFADGYPSSLQKITEPQLERFIPFMVQCSLGYVHIHSMTEFNKPEWWPTDLEFTKPFKRPKSFTGNWLQKMREIVVVCYTFHHSVYLLRYCSDLAKYQPTALRFINNYNSTTSLFERATNKLLVTFRNENMLYDQEQKINSRKCLLPKQSNSQTCLAAQEEMVISEGFDIYLCDNCDAELYSYGALVEHEKTCNNEESNAQMEYTSDDDDVIFCGEVFGDQQLPLDAEARAQAEQQKMVCFLSQNFMLRCTKPTDGSSSSLVPVPKLNSAEADGGTIDSSTVVAGGNHRRLPRRTRQVVTLAKCSQIPLSSPLGLFMLKTSKTITTSDYFSERFDRMERFCLAPPLPPGAGYLECTAMRQRLLGSSSDVLTTHDRRLPKWLFAKPKSGNGTNGWSVTFKRAADDSSERLTRQYKFPRRQFSSKHREENFQFYNKPLLERCRPFAVALRRLTPAEVQDLSSFPGIERKIREAQLAAALERHRRKELAELADSAMIIDSIDLCSSDEENSEEEKVMDEVLYGSGMVPEVHMMDEDENAMQQVNNTLNDRISPDEIETIVLEMDDSMGSDTNELTNTSFYENRSPSQKVFPGGVHSPLVPRIAKKSFLGSMLSESTYRLNQTLPASHTNGRLMEGPLQTLAAPLYLYGNCSQAAVNISDETPPLANGNRFGGARKGSSLPSKENVMNGFGGTASSTTNGESAAVPVHQATVPPRTLLLAAPITNGHPLFGNIPVSFGSGASLHPRTSASVVQTLTTTTFVNQTVHGHVSINHSNGPTSATVTGTAAANLQ
uniref:Nuclear respiratory factor 1 NLS/DNA-binding dimerisation domain-containing protein n=1 Tax=Anopheles christyi TaxID=43041 RepID=A0A182JX03_9DIPT